MAGWTTYDSTTAEIMPTSVAKPTDLMAGWLATSMDATVTMRMKAHKEVIEIGNVVLDQIIYLRADVGKINQDV